MTACGGCGRTQTICTCRFITHCEPASGTCIVVTGNGRPFAPINFRPDEIPLPRPYGYLLQTTPQNLPLSATTVLIFDDTSNTPFSGGMIPGGVLDRLIAPVDGYYLINGFASIATATADGNDTFHILKNGVAIESQIGARTGNRSVMVLESLVAGDFIQLASSQSGSGNGSTAMTDNPRTSFTGTEPHFWAQWIRPL